MHEVFSLVDTFRRICELAEEPTRAALARTCKTFHEPAIQALWHTIPDLVPAVMLFPQDAWRIDEDRDIIVSSRGLVASVVWFGM